MKLKLYGGHADGRIYDLKYRVQLIEIPFKSDDNGLQIDQYEVIRVLGDPEGVTGGYYEGRFKKTRKFGLI
jgi:hypothetical protein